MFQAFLKQTACFFRRLELYRLDWDISFEYNRVARDRCTLIAIGGSVTALSV